MPAYDASRKERAGCGEAATPSGRAEEAACRGDRVLGDRLNTNDRMGVPEQRANRASAFSLCGFDFCFVLSACHLTSPAVESWRF